jgi:hypothetical protein
LEGETWNKTGDPGTSVFGCQLMSPPVATREAAKAREAVDSMKAEIIRTMTVRRSMVWAY